MADPAPERPQPSRSRAAKARTTVNEKAHDARDTLEKGYRKARAKASSAYASAHDAAEHAVDATRKTAKRAARRGHDAVDTTPLAVLIGGLAVGALAGSLLPATRRERDVMKPVGRTVRKTAVAAAGAAKTAGKDRLDTLGFTSDNAKSQVSELVDGLLKALSDAGKAAGDEVKQARKK